MPSATLPTVATSRAAKGSLSGRRFEATPMTPRGGRRRPAAAATPGRPQAQGALVNANRVDAIVRSSLQGKFSSTNIVRMGDGTFYLPTLSEARHVLDASRLDRKTWLSERFDCDDFSYVLKGEFSSHSYESGVDRHGFCCGIMWGNFNWLNGYHAINWIIDSTQTLKLIEPQSDAIYEASACIGNVNLVLV